MALQSFTLTVGAAKDSDNNDKNYVSGEVIYIKKTNGTLASLYRDLAGTSQIAQDGLSNVTDSKGQFNFFVDAGDYVAEYGSQSTPITVVGPDYFNSRIDETVNQIILDLSASRGYRVKGAFATGFTYELPNDVGLDASGNAWIYTDVDALPFTVPATTTPGAPIYTQVTFNQASNVIDSNGRTLQDSVDFLRSTNDTQVQIGSGANSGAEDGVVTVGSNSSAIAPGSVAIGLNATGEYDPAQEPDINIAQTVTVGWGAKSSGSRGTAVGIGVEAMQHSFAGGRFALAGGYRSVAIGDSAEVPKTSPIAGSNTTDSISIGYFTLSDSNSCISIGTQGVNGERTNASQPNCIAIGQGAHIKPRDEGASDDSIVIGNQAKTAGTVGAPSTAASIAVGFEASVESFNSVAIGRIAEVLGGGSAYSVAIGNRAKASGEATVAIGSLASADVAGAVAIGKSCISKDNAVAIGDAAESSSTSVSIGFDSASVATNSVSIGRLAEALGGGKFNSVAIGNRSKTNDSGSVSVGSLNETSGLNSVALGKSCSATINSVAIGDSSVAGNSSVSIGHEAAANVTNGVAIGRLANASNIASVALGERSTTTADNQVAVGDRHFELENTSTPSTPAAGSARFGFRSNGGVQEFYVVFANGSVKVVANDQ